jgi:YbbR domain-containing protein
MIKLIRNFFLRNWGLKLLSLILAFVLWLSLIPEEKTFSAKTLTISLETHNIPPNLELVEKPEATVDVTFRAPNRLINEITAANVFVKLNLEKATVFQQEYPLNRTMISIPPGAEVIGMSPNKVHLKLERTKEAMLDIVPSWIGNLKEGYSISKIEITPPRVLVRGPESKLEEKDRVSTSPINISGLTAPAEFEADIILPKPDLRLALARNRVKIKIFVEEIQPPAKAEAKKKR